MAKDPGMGHKIVATATALKGKCNAGHFVGEQFEISCHNPGGLCGFFYHDMFRSCLCCNSEDSSPGEIHGNC